MFLIDAPITGRREVARGMFVISMHAPEIATAVRAGQFVNLGWSGGPLLRRPFSVYRVEGEHIEIVLKAVGAGTAELLTMQRGERLSCVGPLGHGYDFASSARSAVLISGGWAWRRCLSPREMQGRPGCAWCGSTAPEGPRSCVAKRMATR